MTNRNKIHWYDKVYQKIGRNYFDYDYTKGTKQEVDFIADLLEHDHSQKILDVGCGYGRDALYYADNLDCRVLGIDASEEAIRIASGTPHERQTEKMNFERADFAELAEGRYDVVSASNLYQLLRENERKSLREAVMRTLKPAGLFFLSTLSVNDPEHHGRGAPVPGEANSFSFQHKVYLHFCTGEELVGDSAFLNIRELYEHEYDEPRATGEVHHHISWILIGERRDR